MTHPSFGDPFAWTARRAGLSEGELRGPAYHRLFFDLYVGSQVRVTPRLLGRAALSVSPSGSRVSLFTAARIWGGVVPEQANVRISTARHAFLDLAGKLELVDLVVLGDSLVARGRTTPAELVEVADAWRGHGARLAGVRLGSCARESTRPWRPGCGCSSCSPDCRSRSSTTSGVTRRAVGGGASTSATRRFG